jgi:hypothetical protein
MSSFDHRLTVYQAGTLMTSDESRVGVFILVSTSSPLLLLTVVLTLSNGQQRVSTTVSTFKCVLFHGLSAVC